MCDLFETFYRSGRILLTVASHPAGIWGAFVLEYFAAEPWGLAADLTLVVHFGVALFVVAGMLLILFGGTHKIQWVRNPWFRLSHLGLIAFIAGEGWLGVVCPLTRLEQTLRIRAGQPAYLETFTEHWLSPLLFFQAPPWTFTAVHGLAALAILISWFAVPPRWQSARYRSAR